MDQAIKAGISGLIIALFITILSPAYLYFLPQLVASIITIYLFDLKTTKDGLLATFITYLFTLGVLDSLSAVAYFVSNEPVNFTVDIWIILDQILTPLSSLPAALAGVWLAKKRPRVTTPPPPAPIPPV